MSDYLNDPNTHRLATNCLMCRRALRDAISVETGIGPICRKKLGYSALMDAVSEEARKAANGLVHKAGIAMDAGNVQTILDCAEKIEALGLSFLAERIRDRYIEIRLVYENGVQVYRWDSRSRSETPTERTRNVLRVWTPYDASFVAKRRSYIEGQHRPIKNGKDFHWEFDADQAINVLHLLSLCFPGKAAFGEKGIFTIPTVEEFNTKYHSK